jgi:hypothetical protein
MIGISPSDLNKKLLDFISDNPGKSKEEIVRGMKGNPSRLTVLNHINHLQERNVIVLRKDKPNSQIYRIYVNQDDIKTSIYLELSQFKTSYFKLLDAALAQFDLIESRFRGLDEDVQWPWIRKCLKEEEYLLRPLIEIYILILNIYTVVKIFQWNKEVSSKETMSEIFLITHKLLQEIQQKLFDTSKKLYVFRNYDEREMSFDLINYNIRPELKSLARMLRAFQFYDLEREFEPVMEILWKMTSHLISFEDYPFLHLKKKEKDDWRIVLSRYPDV